MWKLSVGGLVGIILCFQYAYGQKLANKIANNLGVKYAVRTNFAVVGRVPQSVAILTLKNKGNTELPSSGYSIFFCHDNFLFPVSYQEELGKYESAPYGGSLLIDGYIFHFIHGCMYEMKAINAAIKPQESKNITLYFSPFSVSKHDAFRNWYIVDDASNYKVIPDTQNRDFVADFETPLNQLRRTDDLDSVPLEPQDRQNNTVPFNNTGTSNGVIPKPRVQTIVNAAANIDIKTPGVWKISTKHRALAAAKKYLASETNIKTDDVAPSNPKTIELNLKPASYFPTNEYGPFSDEAYELKINPNKIEINGASYNGVINGIHTLTSLQAWGKVSRQTIKDGPRFSERALKLDIASNFYKPSEIKRIIDLMAYYKLNRLYLQIWNNHGLRLDIGFGVAEIAGKRCHDREEQRCLFTQLGSKPDGTGKGNGYLTPSQFQNLLKYAAKRNIMIVPSINVGDDARAMVVGMHRAIQQNNEGISLFDPTEVADLRMSGRYPGKDSAINPCRPETLDFVRYMLGNFTDLYARAGIRFNRLHFGSDFNTEQMMTSKHCFPNPPRNATELQAARSHLTFIKAEFLKNIGDIFEGAKVDLSGTVDFFTGFPDNSHVSRMTVMDKSKRYPNISAYAINDDYMRFNPPATPNVPMEVYSQRAQLLKNNGYKVLVSPPHKTKFDTAYEPDPNAPGDYSVATRNVSLREAFSWAPNSRCCNLNLAPEQIANEVTKHGCLTDPLCEPFSEGISGFDGTLATIDSRKLPDIDTAIQLLSPRLMAFAERSWTEAKWEESFKGATPYQPPTGQRQPQLPPLTPPTPILDVDFADQEKDYQRFRNIVGAREVVRLAFKRLPVFCSAPGARVVKEGAVSKLQSSCMYPNMLLFAKNDLGQYEALTTVPNKNVTIKCMYHLPKYRSLFDCQEQRFDANLDKTPYEHVSDHIQQRADAIRREQEAVRRQQQQAYLAQQALIARQQQALLQQQQAQLQAQQQAQQQGQQQGQQRRQGASTAQQGRGQVGQNRQAGVQRGAGLGGRAQQQRMTG